MFASTQESEEGRDETDRTGSESESMAAARAELTNSHVLLNKLYLLVAQFLLKHKAYNVSVEGSSNSS